MTQESLTSVWLVNWVFHHCDIENSMTISVPMLIEHDNKLACTCHDSPKKLSESLKSIMTSAVIGELYNASGSTESFPYVVGPLYSLRRRYNISARSAYLDVLRD